MKMKVSSEELWRWNADAALHGSVNMDEEVCEVKNNLEKIF